MKVFLLCIMAKIISTLREVQASSGGMHCEWKKCVRLESHPSTRTAVLAAQLSHYQFYPILFTKQKEEPPNNPCVMYWQR